MIYHILPSNDVFSVSRGGAIARDIANIMRFDQLSVVVCESADDTWGFETNRVLVIPQLIPYAKIRGRGYLPAWTTTAFFRRVFRPFLLRLRAGDVVWFHGQPAFCVALERLIHAKGAKLIYHAHATLAPFHVRSKIRLFVADAYIFVSKSLKDEALRYLPKLQNVHVVFNGADEALFYPAALAISQDRTAPVVLYVGRLHPEKGVHVLMQAMAVLQERGINAVCKVFGSTHAYGSRTTAYVRRLLRSKPSNVQFEGFRSAKEIGNEFRAADIFCCPSVYNEPFGNVNIEAMACGVPIVATRVGGIPEIGAEGGVLLVKPNSSLAIADALQRAIQDKQLRKKLATEGLASFHRRFTWSVIHGQYQEIVDALDSALTCEIGKK